MSEVEIEELHRQAVCRGETSYTDPSTGFLVMTELAHLQRGHCCGNQCRHCPYGWTNVRSGTRRASEVISGDPTSVQARLDEIQAEQFCYRQTSTGGRKGGLTTAKNVPYTRDGDQGTSRLATGERRSKADQAFHALGEVDELCAVVGVVHATLETDIDWAHFSEDLLDVMSRLFDIGSHLAKPRRQTAEFTANGVGGGLDPAHVDQLEQLIDQMTEDLPELTSFILPTGSPASAQLHVARTVCRRAERWVVPLLSDGVCDPTVGRYLNRLSDYFFTAARWVNYRLGQEEIQYRRPSRTSKQRDRVTVRLEEEEKKV